MKERIIKTYESYNLDDLEDLEDFNVFGDLDLGRFASIIDTSKLSLPNNDGTFDYNGDLDFSWMKLKSFSEIPIRFREVAGNFNCSHNEFISLQYAPEKVNGYFYCHANLLISLQYAPIYVIGNFLCGYNNLLSKANRSRSDGGFSYDRNPFSITDKVIDTIKRMTIEQRASELKFFEENDTNAYKMMLKAMNENDIGYGKEAQEMVKYTDSLKNAKEMF